MFLVLLLLKKRHTLLITPQIVYLPKAAKPSFLHITSSTEVKRDTSRSLSSRTPAIYFSETVLHVSVQ